MDMSDIDLTVEEQTALKVLAETCNYSEHAHRPEETILHKVQTDARGDIKKALKSLHKRGLCIRHPTRGGMTYNITREGITLAYRI